MILLPQYHNKCIAVFGLGKTGLSVVNSLLSSGCTVFAWDDNQSIIEHTNKLYPMCSYIHPKFYQWNTLSALILSPGIPNFCSEKQHWIISLSQKHNCPITSDIEIFHNSQKAKFICISGTNGKSTTSALIYHILNIANLNVSMGGNFGYPVLDLQPNKDIYILELSSYQISLLKNFKADIAVLLNITPDHLEFHGNMENYIAVKRKIIEMSNLAIIGCNNILTEKLYQDFSGTKIAISLKKKYINGVYLLDRYLLFKEKKIDIGEMKIDIVCNFENIAASYIIAHYLNIHDDIIIQGLRSFTGLNHRNQLLGNIGHIKFINDSKATNAASTKQIISSYRNIYWIVGGRSKYGGIEILSKYFVNVKKAFLIGESTDKFAKFLRKENLNFEKCYALEVAVNLAYQEAQKDTAEVAILLSPSCSSLDQWKNFEERGNKFTELFTKFHQTSQNNRIKICSSTT